jgi:hypothetical protein
MTTNVPTGSETIHGRAKISFSFRDNGKPTLYDRFNTIKEMGGGEQGTFSNERVLIFGDEGEMKETLHCHWES